MNTPSNSSVERDLMLRVAAREEEAFEALYDRFSRVLFSMIVRILESRSESEEVLQEAFWQIWEQAPKYDATMGTPFCWCVTVARRRSIDRLRANSRHLQRLKKAHTLKVETDFEVALAGGRLDETESARAVRDALGELASEQRVAIQLAFFDGLTHNEIAEALDSPVGTIKARIRRGLAKLKKRLGADSLTFNSDPVK